LPWQFSSGFFHMLQNLDCQSYASPSESNIFSRHRSMTLSPNFSA
jgi:hypothetical protein